MQSRYILSCNNNKIWDHVSLIDFLTKNQNKKIVIYLLPEAPCLESVKLYEILDNFNFEHVCIITHNVLEKHHKYTIKHDLKNKFLSEQVNVDPELHQWKGNKVFMTYYGRPTANRLGLSSYLYTMYPEQSSLHFSFGNDLDQLEFYEMDKLLNYDIDSAKRAASMITAMPLTQKCTLGYDRNHYDFRDPLTAQYQFGLIDIVGETHDDGRTFFVTEKTTRPMWLKKPFVIFASKNYLAYLRQLGFRTFTDFWDEEYDGYKGRDRYLKILKLIDDLARKSHNELEKMYWDMQYTLDHNYNLLKTQTYNKRITEII